MKNKIDLKNIFLKLVFISGLLIGLSSCMDDKKTNDTKEVAESKNEAVLDNTSKEKDAQFLVSATEIYLTEIKLGQLAQQKAKMADVKALGKTMEQDHTKTLAEVTNLAMKKTITVPATLTEKGMDADKKLSNISAKDFDKAYCDMMVSGHKDAIAMFQKASVECSDTDIKAWATEKLPHLQMHLDKSTACQTKLDKIK